MTKPVTGVAMMILYEEGKWLPSDPIAKYVPAFAHLKVFRGIDKDGKMILVDPDHAPTMSELMTHTAGFSYGNGTTAVDAMYRDLRPLESASLQEMIEWLREGEEREKRKNGMKDAASLFQRKNSPALRQIIEDGGEVVGSCHKHFARHIFYAAEDAFRRCWYGVDGGRLLPLCADVG